MWQDLLRKTLELDDTSCCEDARMALIMYFEKYAEIAGNNTNVWDGGKGLRASLLQTANILSEESCEVLKESIRRFQDIWDLDRSDLFDADELRDIMDKWEKCEDELLELNEKEFPLENIDGHY
tara:strand:- start:513 stop:884 length:372 start_codon:yes stop_codon:yes gene_type:complete